MQASVNERELVLDMLLQITRDGEYSHIVIKNVLDKYQYLDKRERAFITRVVNGTLERMIEIDYIINQFSKVKVNKMKPVIRTRCSNRSAAASMDWVMSAVSGRVKAKPRCICMGRRPPRWSRPWPVSWPVIRCARAPALSGLPEV